MLNMMDCTTKPDDREVFCDGILYIISEDEQMNAEHDGKYSVVVKFLDAEYDDPWSLSDIYKNFPKVRKVIYDTVLHWYVYNYGNHPMDKEQWELVGTTLGYA